MEGFFQGERVLGVEVLGELGTALGLSLSFSRDGGEPIMPPSRNLIVIGGRGGLSVSESSCCWFANESVRDRRRAIDGVEGAGVED